MGKIILKELFSLDKMCNIELRRRFGQWATVIGRELSKQENGYSFSRECGNHKYLCRADFFPPELKNQRLSVFLNVLL